MRLLKPSLQNRLLRHVLLPLGATWLVGTSIMLAVALYFTQQAFDRSLLDDAYLVASHVQPSPTAADGSLELSLSAQEMKTVLFDQTESLFFAVFNRNGALIAGHTGLSRDLTADAPAVQFGHINHQNKELRSVRLFRPNLGGFYVVMAQTTSSRDRLLHRLLAFSIAPQILLLIWLAFWLQRAIADDLLPLKDLSDKVRQRDAQDLTPVAVPASTRDVQRLGQSINALLGRIAASVQAQREFAGNVAHELRTPLAGIRALADYGLRHSDPQIWREQLLGISQSQERASHLIDQLLALALADESKNGLEKKPLSLDTLVHEAVLRFLPRADAANVDLGATGVDHPVQIQGDAGLLEGILNNLIDNALRYGRSTTGESRITIAITQTAHQVHLSVTDNGAGVASDKLQQISRRWVQGSAGEALKSGSGLGLAIVGAYAKLLDATLSVSNAQPHGLSVSVAFAAH